MSKKKKRIMLVHHSGIVGGAGISFINIVKNLAEDNVVEVYIPDDPVDISELMKSNGINAECYGRRIGAVTYYSGGDSVFSLRFLYRLSLIFTQWRSWNRLIKDKAPDLVIVNSKILCWMSRLGEVKRRKSICFVRETMNGSSKKPINRVITWLLSGFNKVIFLSEYDRECEGLDKAKTEVVHNYVDEALFDRSIGRSEASEELGLRQDTTHVLFVGGVSEMKGFDIALRSVLKCGKNVELVAAGNHFDDAMNTRDKSYVNYSRHWQEYLKANDKYRQIHMVGRQKNMSMCYSACDILLFPMRSPHQSRPAFEAGYYSMPVIITDFKNISEFVRNGDNGFRVPANDVDAVADKIGLLAENNQLLREMGKRNLENTDKLHNKKKNSELIKGIVKEVAER